MDNRVLRAFCDIAEHGSLTRAAAALGETQSGLSRRISGIESELGGRLFHRTGRGMGLTVLGQQLLPRARTIVAELDGMLREARGEQDSPSGAVEIGVVPGISKLLMRVLFQRVRELYPRIRLRALEGYSGQVEEWLASGRVEVGVYNSYGPGIVRGAEMLLQSQVAVVGRRALVPKAKQGSFALSGLRGMPLVLPSRPNLLHSVVADAAARQRFSLDVVLEAGTGALIRDAVEHNDLCTLMPLHFAQRDFSPVEFSIVPLSKPVIRQYTWMMMSTQRPATHAARLVAHQICALAPAIPSRYAA